MNLIKDMAIPEQDKLHNALVAMRDGFHRNPYPTAEERRLWLDKLREMVIDNQQAIIDAINKDFGYRAESETRLLEMVPVLSSIRFNRKRIKSWMKPQRRASGILFTPGVSRLQFQPLGIVGIITPWNYPLYMSLGPIISAFSAGNRCMVKMSEHTPAFGQLLAELCQNYLGSELVQIFNGGADTGRHFASQPFDHLIFTGSSAIGRRVMSAASENLTPVTLELGGKCPVIIGQGYPIQEAAERLLWPKCLNAGQSCTAPDYILCPEDKVDELVNAFRDAYHGRYPDPANNPDCTQIINSMQLERLQLLIDDAENQGAKVIQLADYHRGNLRMPLTILLDVNDDMMVMEQEIFGPILPIIPYKKLNDALAYIGYKPHALAAYLFSYNRRQLLKVQTHIQSGSLAINDATVHIGIDNLPFGGVGQSGMGYYHGKEGFQAFSNLRGFHAKGRFSLTRLAGAPYDRWLPRLIQKLFIR